jgi:hypothetical protein
MPTIDSVLTSANQNIKTSIAAADIKKYRLCTILLSDGNPGFGKVYQGLNGQTSETTPAPTTGVAASAQYAGISLGAASAGEPVALRQLTGDPVVGEVVVDFNPADMVASAPNQIIAYATGGIGPLPSAAGTYICVGHHMATNAFGVEYAAPVKAGQLYEFLGCSPYPVTVESA